MAAKVRVEGADAVLKAFQQIRIVLPLEITKGLRVLGREVQRDASVRFAPYSQVTADRYRTRVTKLGRVSVDNPSRKTTGRHPEYGRLQMEVAFVPALHSKEELIHRGLEELVEKTIRDTNLK